MEGCKKKGDEKEFMSDCTKQDEKNIQEKGKEICQDNLINMSCQLHV